MIEVNLFSIPAGESRIKVGKCVVRNRFDKDSMGITIEQFVKGFLKDNLDKFEAGIGSPELTEMINSEQTLSRKDLASVNYYLSQIGYTVKIFNVADDEEDPVTVPSGIIEWNSIDRNFLQYDYPTATKNIPGEGMDIPAVLRQIVETSGLFNLDKFAGLKNPLLELLNNLDRVKEVTGDVSSSITTRIYDLLDELGVDVFCATPED